jgi:ParB-like chromosome segregation protein Spo0J
MEIEIKKIKKNIEDLLQKIDNIDLKINIINELREVIHDNSPLKNEPVDFVKWVKGNKIIANEYNPNKVAPPEMKLLEISIMNDGYTQPIVTFSNEEKNIIEVVDGFHRNRVGKESKIVNDRIKGYLPVVSIRKKQSSKNDRMASTIRHNRARGKHTVDAMSEIVLELKNRNWKNERIAKELGMDMDEILRLCQISGLEDIFKDKDFSRSWNIEDNEDDFIPLTDEVTEFEKQQYMFKSVNTNDEDRIFHTFDKWECQKKGFYKHIPPNGMTKNEAENEYAKFFSNLNEFEISLNKVIYEWKNSCEHYLTNKAMNRIAWLGQACACYYKNLPSEFRSGFNLLSEKQKNKANELALKYLNIWMINNNRNKLTMEEAIGGLDRQVEIY